MILTLRDCRVLLRWTPHPVKMTIKDSKGYIRVLITFLLYHCYRVGGPPQVVPVDNLEFTSLALNRARQGSFWGLLLTLNPI